MTFLRRFQLDQQRVGDRQRPTPAIPKAKVPPPIRFRSLLQTLEDLIEPARTPLQGPGPDGAPSYDQMINGTPPSDSINGTPPSDSSGWDDQTRAAFTDVKAAVVALGDTYAQVNGVISHDAPKPEPRLQVRPKPLT